MGDKGASYQELASTNALNPNLGNRLAREIEAYMKKVIAEKQQAEQQQVVEVVSLGDQAQEPSEN